MRREMMPIAGGVHRDRVSPSTVHNFETDAASMLDAELPLKVMGVACS